MNKPNLALSRVGMAAMIVVALVVGIVGGYGAFSVATPPQTTTTTSTLTVKETLTTTETLTATVTVTVKEMAPTLPSVVVADQEVVYDMVTINSVYLDKPGYVAIHIVTLEGKPGKVLGHSALLGEGVHEGVTIKISGYEGRGELYAMLHYDDGDGEYSFPGPDRPVIAGGAIIQALFRLMNSRPAIAVSDQQVVGNMVLIDGLYLDRPGYVGIHLVTEEGRPGAVIGHSSLLVGQNNRVPVIISGHEGEKRLIAMLHYDDGDGDYEFPGPDAPVVLDGRVVLAPFAIS